MKFINEKWVSVLFIGLAAIIILTTLLNNVLAGWIVDVLWGIGGVLSLLVVLRIVSLFVRRKAGGDNDENQQIERSRTMWNIASLLAVIAFLLLAWRSETMTAKLILLLIAGIALSDFIYNIFVSIRDKQHSINS